MKLIPRLVTLLAILLAVHTVYAFVQSGGLFTVRQPANDLNELPLQLGDWVCSDPTGRGAEEDNIAGADVSIQRVYRQPGEHASVSVYAAIWTTHRGFFNYPHKPPTCYTSSGHRILDMSETELNTRDGSTAKTSLMHTELADRPTDVLYWYQLDQHTMYSTKQMGKVRLNYLGKYTWPPLVKVMLEVNGMDQQNAKRLLVDLGEQILDWTSSEL